MPIWHVLACKKINTLRKSLDDVFGSISFLKRWIHTAIIYKAGLKQGGCVVGFNDIKIGLPECQIVK